MSVQKYTSSIAFGDTFPFVGAKPTLPSSDEEGVYRRRRQTKGEITKLMFVVSLPQFFGNILFPKNSCLVRGSLADKKVPKNSL